MIETVSRTCGMDLSMASTCPTTSLVRATEALSGS